ncbi:MAG: hypothetical protein WBC44_22235 [Planctomycetaceae bacterium]
MPKRAMLRKQLVKAWSCTIKEKYDEEQLINSERGLQIYFCHELLKAFGESGKERRIFVEPCVKSVDGRRYPDLLICNAHRIIGVVEIKYLPRGKPKYDKDFDTLSFFATHPGGLTVSNDRYRGVSVKKRAFQLADDAVLCWAGVYTGERLNLRLDEPHGDRFLQLDALTVNDGKPTICQE